MKDRTTLAMSQDDRSIWQGSIVKMVYLILLLKIFSTILFSGPVYAEEQIGPDYEEQVGLDYFDPKYKGTLASVERHHLSKQSFWEEYGSRHYGQALNELKFVLRYFPNHPKALQLMELVAKVMNQPYSVTFYYARAVKLYPQYALTHAQYGNYLVGIGQTEEGIGRLQRAIQIDPKLASAYFWLWDAYTKIGNLEMARQIAEKAKERGLNVQDRSK